MIRKCIGIIICCVLVLGAAQVGVLPVAGAAEIIRSGSCGENVNYTFDSNGVLTLSGSGPMTDFGWYGSPFYSDDIIKKAANSIIIHKGITSIGNYAFTGCAGVTNITIPEGVTYIGNYSFENCSRLSNVVIPDSVTMIGIYAFYGCVNLANVNIPKNVTAIGGFAFGGCHALREITIPDGVKTIEPYTFLGCESLVNVFMPNSISTIGSTAFFGCIGLKNITIPQGVSYISSSAFTNCTGLSNVTIPNGVTTIGDSAFSGCEGLLSVSIPPSVTNIGDSSFTASQTIPDQAVIIGIEDSYAKLWAQAYNKSFMPVSIEFFDPYHEHDYVSKIETVPTCKNSGSQILTCSLCGYYYVEKLNLTDHNFGDWEPFNDIQHQRVCLNDTTHTETADHTWDEGMKTSVSCTEVGKITYTCTVCGANKTESFPATGHAWGEWIRLNDDQHRRVCANNAAHVETDNHEWTAGVITVEPTYESDGVRTITCRICGATREFKIDKLQPQANPGDVSGNGKVLADDARQILRYSAKFQNEFVKVA